MSAIKLREDVWSVGVLNPSLRVFDIVMTSPYGTSYNAYLVTGGEKTALIETVHKDYFDQLVGNIEEVLPLEKLDYLIMNHTEPDHSGSVRALLERCPNLTVLCSNPARKFLSAIANEDFPCRVVKDGDTLDLGGKTLTFLSAPLLHWPDTMFTWDPADQTLFTCDFLGAHFCEPTMVDTGIQAEYRGRYEAELKNYFDCIFGPFHPAVLAALTSCRRRPGWSAPATAPALPPPPWSAPRTATASGPPPSPGAPSKPPRWSTARPMAAPRPWRRPWPPPLRRTASRSPPTMWSSTTPPPSPAW